MIRVKRIWPYLLVVVVLLSVAISAGVVPILLQVGTLSIEDRICESLRTIASAQSAFRSLDLDGSGKPRFWRDDVAGLYAVGTKQVSQVGLIGLSFALADEKPRTDLSAYGVRQPMSGIRFRSLRFSDEGQLDSDRYAIIAFADTLALNGFVYLITHDGTIYKKIRRSHTERPETCPTDPSGEGWLKMSR
jgi:hypothetical protein